MRSIFKKNRHFSPPITIYPSVQTGIGDRAERPELGKDCALVLWTAKAYVTTADGKSVYQAI